jgi:hypothetical protein
MTTESQYYFKHKELIALMIKGLDIHEGHWMLSVQFGMVATNVSQNNDSSDAIPAAIVSINTMGIQRSADISDVTVNAAEVNPA